MRAPLLLSLGLALAASAVAAPAIQLEAGVSHFWIRDTRADNNPSKFWSDEPTETVPFVAAKYSFTDRFGLRLSYHYLDDVHTTAEFGHPPGEVAPQIVVWGHFHDDIHVVSLAPEFSWSLTPQLVFAVAPQLNWVTSSGVVSYTTNDPTVLLVGPRDVDDDGFTFGGSVRASWALSEKVSLSLGYQYMDLDPSFDRRAHVASGGVTWTF